MTKPENRKPILKINALRKYFPVEKGFFKRAVGHVRAVDDVSFVLHEGETLGLVGESGCGKSTLGRCIVRITDPTSGEILFRGPGEKWVDLALAGKKQMRTLRPFFHMVFQDPSASLSPRMTILDVVGEPLLENGLAKGKKLEEKVKDLMTLVGLDHKLLKRYPHAFSGGQRQRIGIARALACSPRLIVADEPVSALDVSVQAQILNLFVDLQKKFNLAYLFVAHDLAVVQHISDRVAVMYLGRLVEFAPTEELFQSPLHPYTEALLAAHPSPDPAANKDPMLLQGEVANPADPPSGCAFHPRCPYAEEICKKEEPRWREIQPGRLVLCHRVEELDLKGAGKKSRPT